MSKTKNSRFEINQSFDKKTMSIWDSKIKKFTNKFSRHPNRKRPRHTLVKEWRESESYYNDMYTEYYKRDGRLGNCYMRSDRNTGSKYSVHGIRRAHEKELIREELNNIEQDY